MKFGSRRNRNRKMKKFEVIISVPENRIVDMFISACEGGSNYWCSKVTPIGKSKDPYKAMLKGFKAVDNDSKKTYVVEPVMIDLALTLMAQDHGKHFSNMITEINDNSMADVFFQLCVFGDVIYG